MTRRAPGPGRAAAAALLGLTLLVPGCGVPTSSDVQYVRPGPAAGSSSPGEGHPPPHPDAAETPGEQVENFLQAAAGSPTTAPDRVREYLTEEQRAGWRPEEGIRVVRLLQEPFISDEVGGGWVVDFSAQVVGELHPHGYLDAPTVTEPVEYRLRVVPEGPFDTEVTASGPRLRVADPPPYLLMEDTALANDGYYYPNPIYFWDDDHAQLVPDLRWLPLAGEPAEQHPWTVMQWLLAGPAPGLPRVEGLPAGTAHIGTPVWEGDRLVVNLNAAAVEGRSVDDLATQLAHSLLQLRSGDPELELRIEDRARPARVTGLTEPADPTRYAVLEGTVHRHDHDAEDAGWPAALPEELNTGVAAAALTSDGAQAALVRTETDGRRRLTVVRAHPDGGPTDRATDLVGERIGQPVWVGAGRAATGLVVVDGALHWFTVTGQTGEVTISGLAGPVSAVAVAPERRRVALVAGDRLYLAQLRVDAEPLTVQAPRLLPTTVRELAGVAFVHETRLVVAGEQDGRVGLHRLTVDGAVVEPLHDLGNATVTALAAHPTADANALPRIMYEANGQAYTFTGVPNLIRPDDLADAPEDAESTPRAPFFAG